MYQRIKKVIGLLAASLFLSFAIAGIPCMDSLAAQEKVNVVPTQGVLYTGNGAEIFAAADPTTLVAVFPGDIPVQVTGITSNGYFQILWENVTYYVYGQALSISTGTQAYKLTSIDARAALVGDMNTGALIYSQNATDRLAPASTTKLMTALLVLEAVEQGRLSLDTPLIVSSSALATIPWDASHVTPKLKEGEVMNVMALLECVLVKSDCHACNVLAEAVAGDEHTFAAMMTARATQLGCVDTNFVNAHGYTAEGHYTNAYSLFLIMREVMKYPTFQSIVSTPQIIIPATNLTAERVIDSTDLCILPGAYYNPAVIGGKTGTTSAAGACFVGAASRNGKNVISVILGSGTRTMSDGSVKKQQFSETNKLLEIGLAN